MARDELLQQIREELQRIGATDAQTKLDRDFEPEAGELAYLQLETAEWRMLPAELVELLEDVPSGAGNEAIKKAIESKGTGVWHGPAPESRDTSP